MFHHLVHIVKTPWRFPIWTVIGDETRNKGLGIQGLTTGHTALFWQQDDPRLKAFSTEKPHIWLAYRKIALLIIWPPKLLELISASLYWGLDQLCLLGVDKKEREKNQQEKEILQPLSSPGDFFRVVGRALVFLTFGLAHELIRYIGSPYNQLIKPIYRHFEIGLAELDKGTQLLVKARKEQQKFDEPSEQTTPAEQTTLPMDEHTAIAGQIAIDQKFRAARWLQTQGVWEIAKGVLLIAAGLAVIGFMVAAIFFSSGAALPLLALIQPAMSGLVGFLGGSAIAASVVEAVTLVAAFVVSQVIMQHILAIPAYLKDLWMGFTGRGGYDTKMYTIKELEPEVNVEEDPEEDPEEILKKITEAREMNWTKSTALLYQIFNDPLEFPTSASKPASKGGNAENHSAAARTESNASNASSLSGDSRTPASSIAGSTAPSQPQDQEANSANDDEEDTFSLFGGTKASKVDKFRASLSSNPKDLFGEDVNVSVIPPKDSGGSEVTRKSFAPSSLTPTVRATTTENLLSSSGTASLVMRIGGDSNSSSATGGERTAGSDFNTTSTGPTTPGAGAVKS